MLRHYQISFYFPVRRCHEERVKRKRAGKKLSVTSTTNTRQFRPPRYATVPPPPLLPPHVQVIHGGNFRVRLRGVFSIFSTFPEGKPDEQFEVLKFIVLARYTHSICNIYRPRVLRAQTAQKTVHRR